MLSCHVPNRCVEALQVHILGNWDVGNDVVTFVPCIDFLLTLIARPPMVESIVGLFPVASCFSLLS